MPDPRRATLYAMVAVVAALPAIARAAETVTASLKGTTLHVAAPAGDWANTQLLIDADGDATTGFRVDAHGFDVMVEGATVYRFTGPEPTAWTWQQLGMAKRSTENGTLAIELDTALLPAKSANAGILLRGLSPTYEVVKTIRSEPVNLGGQAAAAATFDVACTQDGTDLVLKVTASTAADLNTLLLFFDADGDANTGFNPPADPRFGFDLVIQGGTLSKHNGPGRDAWAWTALSPVKLNVNGNVAEYRFNASLLNATKLKVAAWRMSADWQTRVDAWPKAADGKAATTDVPIDTAKLRAVAPAAPVTLAPARANANQPARQRFAAARSYACYYGSGQLAPLSHVDAAILHTPAMTAENVKTLSKLGVVTIGYITVGEDDKLRVGNGKGFDGKASWYFDKDKDDKPDANGIWGSYYANAADPLWRADRVVEAKRLCGEYGFDGIFLDTIETVDSYPASREGMIQLVKELRAALPDKVIVMNRGFSLLNEPAVAGNVDGLMFESFTNSYDFDSKTYIRFKPQDMDATRATMVSTVMPAMKQHGLRVLALDYCEPTQTDRIQESFDRATTFGMLPAVSSISLDLVYDTSTIVPKPDPRYLEIQATPEAMQATLDTARNGFPAGTIVQPSSCFPGYSVETVVDGIADHTGKHWTKAAWASAEEPGAKHHLLFKMPEPISGGTLAITFAFDNKSWFASRDFTIEASGDGTTWQTLAAPSGNTQNTFRVTLPNTPFRQLRIIQSPNGGHAERPNLMWIQQVTRVP